MENVNRICKKCNIEKALTNFSKNKLCLNGREHECRQCATIRKNKWERVELRKRKAIYLRYKFKLTIDEYEQMQLAQNNLCAICYQNETNVDKRWNKLRDLAVDHCHRTGTIRALLCTKCNILLGTVNDNVSILENAIKYLQRFK